MKVRVNREWCRSRVQQVMAACNLTRNEAGDENTRALEIARDELSSLKRTSEAEIGSLAKAFGKLAGQTGMVFELASAIVGCIEDDGVRSMLPRVQRLGAAATSFVEARLQATRGILEQVTTEMQLLRQLSAVTKSQTVIALKTRVLTMMTNVEVGRLGASGKGFEHLAAELTRFSGTLSEDTEELARHIETRRLANEATKRVLAAELPRLAEEFARIDANLGDDLTESEMGFLKLTETPVYFKASVKEIGDQIAGVTTAVQSYDITSQQIGHIEEALSRISTSMRGKGSLRHKRAQARSQAYVAMTIQVYQLRHVRETVANWVSRIRACMKVVVQVGASDVMGIEPMAREREREISTKLAHIEVLESESKGYSERIRRTVGEHSSLVRLIDQQVKKAKVIRQLLHLLSLNSIVEASWLGAQANAMLEIGSGISELSAQWSEITDQSEQVMQEIVRLVERIDQSMTAFSDMEDATLREAQAKTQRGLDSLRAAAEFAAGEAQKIHFGLANMQTMSEEINKSADILDASYGQVDAILSSIQQVQRSFQNDHADVEDGVNATETEKLFAAAYTTDAERDVLHAALGGAPLPRVQHVS